MLARDAAVGPHGPGALARRQYLQTPVLARREVPKSIWLGVGTIRTSRREPGPALAPVVSSGQPRAACGPHRPRRGLDSPLGACAWSLPALASPCASTK